MNLLWLGLCSIIAAATVSLPAGQWSAGAALLLAGLGALAATRARQEPRAWPREALVLLAPIAIAAMALPPTGRWACGALALGLTARCLWSAGAGSDPSMRTPRSALRHLAASLAEALTFAAAVVVACVAFHPLYLSLWARAQGWPPLAAAVQLFATALGWDARGWGATLTLADGDTVYQHALTMEGMLPYPLLCVALLGMALLLAMDRRPVRLLGLTAALAVFCAARYLLLVRLTVEGLAADPFWNPLVATLSTLAPAVLLGGERLNTRSLRSLETQRAQRARRKPERESLAAFSFPAFSVLSVSSVSLAKRVLSLSRRGRSVGGRRSAVVPRLMLLSATSILAAGLYIWTEAGVPKAGRVLVDESHSDWSASTRPFDTSWFGIDSTYNYASFAEYLNHFFRLSINEREPLTPRLLRECDVLLVKMPTRAFTPVERVAVDTFVRRGGGLWLIGDHTNVFGTSVHLNALSAPMGIRFREDATWDLGTGGPALWRTDGGAPTHPTLGRVSRFEFQTGCSLEASLGAEDLLLAPAVVARQADYGTPNFFPTARPNNFNGAFGPALLGAAARYGAGRVAAFTDSTSFSTFSIFARGRPELAVDTLAWLNRRGRSPWPARLAIVLALGAALWLAAGLAGAASRMRWLGSGGALSSLTAALVLARFGSAAALPTTPERPEAPIRRVYVLASGTDALFENLDPLYWSVAEDPDRERRFTTFLIGSQRFGLVPTVVREVPTFSRAGDALVIPRPRRPLTAVQLARVVAFVRDGGRALVLPDNSSPDGSAAALDALLLPFGLQRIEQIEGPASVTVPGARLRLVFQRPFHLHGGVALARDARGREMLVRATLGRGEILVAGDGQLFANASLGNHFDVPSGAQGDALALQFWLFRHVMLADRAVARCYPERRGRWITQSPPLRAARGRERG